MKVLELVYNMIGQPTNEMEMYLCLQVAAVILILLVVGILDLFHLIGSAINGGRR